MNNPDRNAAWSSGNGIGQYLPEGLWGLNDTTAGEEPPVADLAGGLVGLGFITAALRRRRRLWCALAAAGFLLGCGLYLKSPPTYQASTSLLLTLGPYENISTAAADDQAMAQSVSVAGLAVRELGLKQSAGSFLATYKATPITERIIAITVSARSSNQAVLDASAVATAFLQFRADEMQSEQKLVLASLNHQVSQAQQHLSSIKSQIGQLPAQPASTVQQSQLKILQAEYVQADNTLYQIRLAALGNQTTTGSATTAAVNGSKVLDAAAPLAHSRLKPLILHAAFGLMGGLALGVAIVVVQALISDKLRRRDDVAQALGSPVRLSVGAIRMRQWLPGRKAYDVEIQRIADHIRRAVPGSSRGPATLVVVPVDDPQVPALSLMSLALSFAGEGKKVVVADLCSGAPVARLLGAQGQGIHEVSAHDARLVVAVPELDDVIPAGPLDRGLVQAERSDFTGAVADACAAANLLLTLAALDPSLGGEHLATWATDAVAVVTAGRSSWTKIHSVAEMIRLAGMRLVSAVLVGADKTDETLGTVPTPEMV